MPGWAYLQRKIQQANADLTGCHSERPILSVDIERQVLTLVHSNSAANKSFSISTSRNGPGQQRDSCQTPTGLHTVAKKIGGEQPPGRVFRARQATAEICLPEDYRGEEDVITSRILWLRGLEPGKNSGGNVDTQDRYIYIHGTPDEARLGRPASIGCVRMRNDDVISLYDKVKVGDLVYIE